jgi:hypothetical protein
MSQISYRIQRFVNKRLGWLLDKTETRVGLRLFLVKLVNFKNKIRLGKMVGRILKGN